MREVLPRGDGHTPASCLPPASSLHSAALIGSQRTATAATVITGILFLRTCGAEPVRFIFSFNYHTSPIKQILLPHFIDEEVGKLGGTPRMTATGCWAGSGSHRPWKQALGCPCGAQREFCAPITLVCWLWLPPPTATGSASLSLCVSILAQSFPRPHGLKFTWIMRACLTPVMD